MNEHEVAKVDDTADALSGNEDRILPVDGIREGDQAADHAHIPEGRRHAAFSMAFGGDPLDHPAHEEDSLSEESDNQPNGVECHSGTEAEVDPEGDVVAPR